jgi:WD40 repeat protein
MSLMRTPLQELNADRVKTKFHFFPSTGRVLTIIVLGCLIHAKISNAADTTATYIPSASATISAPDPNQHIPQEIKRLKVAKYINAVAWTADGSRLAAVSGFGGDITVWDTKTWDVVKEFHNHGSMDAYNSLSFLQDGSLLTTPTLGPSPDPKYQTLKIFSLVQWNPESATPVRYIPNIADPSHGMPPNVGPTHTFAVSGDGAWIAGLNGMGVLLFESKNGSLSRFLAIPDVPTHKDIARALAFSPDGKELAVCTAFGMVHIFSLQGGPPHLSFMAYPNERFSCGALAYSPDGRYIATGRHKSSVTPDLNETAVDIWRASDGSKFSSLDGSTMRGGAKGEAAVVRTLSWSQGGDVLAVGDDLSLRLWRVTESNQTLLFNKDISHGAYSVSYSPQGVLAATDNNEVVIYQ